ncbi:hypothetical protein LBW89_15500 [Paenibacillus sp. alder61]|uniref:hypothetical protein n=1 Tax=Paenibacillus TaxID=44249 RepID=UPI001CD1C90B|nr:MULTISPECIES: hypothetical protein [Paenibacillus]MCA1294434.1 hypothetical protein [Paenibacillus sp. alder61]
MRNQRLIPLLMIAIAILLQACGQSKPASSTAGTFAQAEAADAPVTVKEEPPGGTPDEEPDDKPRQEAGAPGGSLNEPLKDQEKGSIKQDGEIENTEGTGQVKENLDADLSGGVKAVEKSLPQAGTADGKLPAKAASADGRQPAKTDTAREDKPEKAEAVTGKQAAESAAAEQENPTGKQPKEADTDSKRAAAETKTKTKITTEQPSAEPKTADISTKKPAKGPQTISWSGFFDGEDQTTPSEQFWDLSGTTVTIKGFMGEVLSFEKNWFLLIPEPGAECPFDNGDETYWNKIMIVFVPDDVKLRYKSEPLQVTGRLDVGIKIDESGYKTMFRLYDAKFKEIKE